MQDIRSTSAHRSTTAPSAVAEILANPGFGHPLHRPHVHVEWTPDDGWHDARVTPYGPLTLDPATAVLHYAQEIFEGMKAYRHEDGSIWTFRPEANAERMTRSQPAAGAARAARRTTSSRPSTRWSRSTSAGCRSGRGEEPLRPPVHDRHRDLPRRAPAQHVTFMVIASPAGAVLQGGVKPSRCGSPRSTRAPAAVAWARPRPAATTPLAGRPAGGHRAGLRPGGLPRRRSDGTSRSSVA